MSIAEEIVQALHRGEFFLNYLPMVSLEDAHCVGAEALLRWRRRKAVLRAGSFMPFIEDTPVSSLITYWVIDTVAAELGQWLDRHPDAHVSVNIPSELLGRAGLAYAAANSELQGHASQLVLEITQRCIPDRLGLAALQALARSGMRIALDDTMLTGTNLSLLARSDFAVLKLDRELTWQLGRERPRPDWIDGLVALLHSGPLQVVAEGVESEYQAEQLRSIGVQFAQGHLFSTPVTARSFMHFHAEQQTRLPM